jgi:Benzoate membrane transport protein.
MEAKAMAPLLKTLKEDWSISATVAGFLAVLISYSGPLIIFSKPHKKLKFPQP